MTEPVRLGVVGIGWFVGVLTESAKATGMADVVICFARSEEARTSFSEKHCCLPVGDVDEMLGDPEVEREIHRERDGRAREGTALAVVEEFEGITRPTGGVA